MNAHYSAAAGSTQQQPRFFDCESGFASSLARGSCRGASLASLLEPREMASWSLSRCADACLYTSAHSTHGTRCSRIVPVRG